MSFTGYIGDEWTPQAIMKTGQGAKIKSVFKDHKVEVCTEFKTTSSVIHNKTEMLTTWSQQSLSKHHISSGIHCAINLMVFSERNTADLDSVYSTIVTGWCSRFEDSLIKMIAVLLLRLNYYLVLLIIIRYGMQILVQTSSFSGDR